MVVFLKNKNKKQIRIVRANVCVGAPCRVSRRIPRPLTSMRARLAFVFVGEGKMFLFCKVVTSNFKNKIFTHRAGKFLICDHRVICAT